MVLTNYKPKLHDQEKLGHMTNGFDNDLLKVFPKGTDEEKRLFEQLKKAYIDAR